MTNTIYFHNTNREEEDSDSVSTTTTEQSPATSRRHTTTGSVTHTPLREAGKLEISLSKRFRFEELRSATENFDHKNLLGRGAVAVVFKGWIDENKLVATKPGKGIPVAIKNSLGRGAFGNAFKGWIDENKLVATKPGKGNPVAIKRLQHSVQGYIEWQTEVKYLGRLYHPNLVRLLGYCIDNDEHLLVREFMPRGRLDNHLFKVDSPPLSWSVRMKIALGAAKGLSFLHSTSVNVIHWNFKSSNILLDMNYNAKISNFGVAMDGPTGGKGYIDTIAGTIGYIAPEYMLTGYRPARIDVYGFGVVLLEMLTGRRAFDINRPSEECSLVRWVESKLERKMYDFADSRLEGQYSLEDFEKAVNLALECLKSLPIAGMSGTNMDEVVKVLEEL